MMSDDNGMDSVIATAKLSVDVENSYGVIALPNNAQDASAIIIRRNPSGAPEFAREIQEAMESRLPAPRRRKDTVHATEIESFIALVNRWKLPNHTTIWADALTVLRAVVDDHPAGPADAGWKEFAIVYRPPASSEWTKWTNTADKDLDQDSFATFIDDNLADVTTVPTAAKGQYPSPVELLEMARNLSIHTRGQFERKIDPTTGSGTLVIKDEHETYSSKIWKAFPLALRVFEGGKVYLVEARIKFRIVSGRAIFSYSLYRKDEIRRDAFNELRTLVTEKCEGVPVYAGCP